MRTKNKKRSKITEKDFLLANRKASREEEILAHGKPVIFRSHIHGSKKKYNRKQLKKAITPTDDGFFHVPSDNRNLFFDFTPSISSFMYDVAGVIFKILIIRA